MAQPLLDAAVADDLQVIFERLLHHLSPLRGKTLGDAILEEETDLQTVKMIKDYGKKLAGRKHSGIEHDIAVTIYFAAIASALLFHSKRITSYAYKDLARDFEMLMNKPWMAPEIATHLSRAKKRCRKKRK